MYGKYPHDLSPDDIDAFKKAVRVVSKCRTYLQMHSALKYLSLFQKMLDKTQTKYYDALVHYWWLHLKTVRRYEKLKKAQGQQEG